MSGPQRWEDWTGARPWTESVMDAWREATHEARARARLPMERELCADWFEPVYECLIERRPFCFLPSVDTVDRVRIRNAAEWRRWVSREYARVAALTQGGE